MNEINEPIRALSWKQPYAGLMLPPHNKAETRTWNTKYRGLVLICASKEGYRLNQILNISGDHQYNRIIDCIDHLGRSGYLEDECAIAVGRLVDCIPMTLEQEDKCFVEYRRPWTVINKRGKKVTKQLYVHVYEDVRPIEPFHWKGTQGWKTLTPEEIKKIKFL